MDKIWSSEAKKYLKELGRFYSSYDSDLNAAHSIVGFNPAGPVFRTFTVVGGMNAVPRRLAEQFKAASDRFIYMFFLSGIQLFYRHTGV